MAKAKPRPKTGVTLSPVSIPIRDRKWIDIDPASFNERLLCSVKIHDQVTAT